MNHFNPESRIAPKLLATDLDGTLIPLPEDASNIDALSQLFQFHQDGQFGLIFATGRHFESVLGAIAEYQLPIPEWIVCDVGSTIYKREGDDFNIYQKYEQHLLDITGQVQRTQIEALLQNIAGLEMQCPDHQQRFKISYETAEEAVENIRAIIAERLTAAELPYECMASVDPFSKRGLIDVLPAQITKAYALIWLATHADFQPGEVIYSGDSGNDYAALVSGFRAIIVANGSNGLVEKVTRTLKSRDLLDRLYVAQTRASSGVLEGCRHFELVTE